MRRFAVAATGGTFDIIHRGHMALLSAAFSGAECVIVGLSSDGLARRRGKSPLHAYPARLARLASALLSGFPRSNFRICRLEDDFGPAVVEGAVDALVLSEETRPQGARLNVMRAARGLGPVELVVVPMVAAADGGRISSTRIRNAEIDSDGNAR